MHESEHYSVAPAARILVKGVVQGVGFRPFIFNLAQSLGLRGFVMNSDAGVIIEIEGANIAAFIDLLKKDAPPLSEIKSIDIVPFEREQGHKNFTILGSNDSGGFTLISPDVCVCTDCLKEMMDTQDRRYLYPFINCTNCGPRYSITERVPYDRKNTTMKSFTMCPDCEKEYHDPGNRRFHAQPNACPVCGPRVELRINNEKLRSCEGRDALMAAIEMLNGGFVVAIKGIGGFHLACDAANDRAVRLLRERKRKSNKPFALMAANIETVERYCELSDEERKYISSPQRPIVLLKKKPLAGNELPELIAPGNKYLGFMLPYTPLHYLLFNHPSQRNGNLECLVMTSGNLSEEPIVTDNSDAVDKLKQSADCFLLHNRDIFMRVDDSVAALVRGGTGDHSDPLIIRRARGFVPGTISLGMEGPEVLGCGADLKNTFTLTKGAYAIMSQHIGDMENFEALRFYEETLENLKAVYRVNPLAMGHDLHPGYMSTAWAEKQQGVKCVPIQHHHAHIASVMAEYGLSEKVIGVAFDGTGYGSDGNIWGGEFFAGDIMDFRRIAHFSSIPLIGGDASIRSPWKTAISYIKNAAGRETACLLERLGFMERFGENEVANALVLSEKAEFCPLSSGAGRLFDAVASIINLCHVNTFEAEAPMVLESWINEATDDDYAADIRLKNTWEIDFSPAIISIINDYLKGIGPDVISARFHNMVVNTVVRVVSRIYEHYGITKVLLSGGAFQNRYLASKCSENLKKEGFDVFTHKKVPCNDASISLGQAYIVREKIARGIV